jgi:O-antigen/teichoic acid export membrane protein
MLPLTFTAILNLCLAYILVPRSGATGAAVANLSAQFTEGLLLLFFSASALAFRIPWARMLRIYLAAVVCFAPAALSAWQQASFAFLAATLAIGCILYSLVLLFLNELKLADAGPSSASGVVHVRP